MGGYGWYVWGSYGVTLVALLIELVVLRSRTRKHETKA
ncbi:MAG TPA: heme exporter protein CcmD [Burkholderiales bacterium]|nr:heme exporter protein CcmD [Burkholderiales bacterium]